MIQDVGGSAGLRHPAIIFLTNQEGVKLHGKCTRQLNSELRAKFASKPSSTNCTAYCEWVHCTWPRDAAFFS